jgi:hypothetical protein
MADMTHQSAARRGRPRGRPRVVGPVAGQPANPDESVARLQLDAAAKHALDSLCDRRGMTLTAAMSRLVQWLVNQDEITQAWVLSQMSRESLIPMSESFQTRMSERDGKR